MGLWSRWTPGVWREESRWHPIGPLVLPDGSSVRSSRIGWEWRYPLCRAVFLRVHSAVPAVVRTQTLMIVSTTAFSPSSQWQTNPAGPQVATNHLSEGFLLLWQLALNSRHSIHGSDPSALGTHGEQEGWLCMNHWVPLLSLGWVVLIRQTLSRLSPAL